MMVTTAGGMQDRIVKSFNGLSPRLRSAAEFINTHPEEVATRTLREVAEAAGLTPPTLSRLARALKFETYEELREVCRRELKRRNRILAEKANALLRISSGKSDGGKSGVFFLQARSAIENIQELMDTIDEEKLRSAADMLVRARTVLLIGTSSGGALASYLISMARLAFENWRITGSGGVLWSAEIAKLGAGDAVFVVSTEPYGNLTVRAAQAARETGADLIAVTDSLASPFGSIASQCFIVRTESPQFFPSHIAAMTLVEGLMGMVVQQAGKRATTQIEKMESTAFSVGEYWAR
jgi:DNA-binding MurR/RpiR family transcriptional regulator